jgi:hypothetical protein
MADERKQSGKTDEEGGDLDVEYEAWDWARTSGVSRDQLRRALQEEIQRRLGG